MCLLIIKNYMHVRIVAYNPRAVCELLLLTCIRESVIVLVLLT
ncbi:hypothetical protein LINPERHAP1_LOCUS39144 [Linum perenne]